MSASVARLREQGVLETSVNAVDGRRTLVSLGESFRERLATRAPVSIDAALATELASPDREDLAQVIDALEAVAERIIPEALRRTRITSADVTEAG